MRALQRADHGAYHRRRRELIGESSSAAKHATDSKRLLEMDSLGYSRQTDTSLSELLVRIPQHQLERIGQIFFSLQSRACFGITLSVTCPVYNSISLARPGKRRANDLSGPPRRRHVRVALSSSAISADNKAIPKVR
jgi:hypothetical protein